MRLLLVRVNKGRIPSFHRVVPRCHTGTTFLLSGKPSWSSTGVLCCRVLSDCDMCGLLENTGSGSRFGYQNYITWVPGKVSKMGEVGPTFIVKNNWRAAEVDWLGGCRHRHPQPGRGSRDLRGERLHGSRDCRGNHLRRLVRVHQRRDEDRLHWLAPQRRHLGDAREVEGRRAGAART